MRALLLLLLFAFPAQSQLFNTASRYELGQRLRLFEQLLDKHKGDHKAIARAVPPLAAVTPAFFAGQFTKAARILDRARLTLQNTKPDEASLWASSLCFKPLRRVAGAKEGSLEVRMERLYKPETAAPVKAVIDLALLASRRTVAAPSSTSPLKAGLSWKGAPEGDHRLTCTIRVGKKEHFRSEQMISLIDHLDARLKKLSKSMILGKKTLEGATLAHHLDILKKLARGETLETDYPAHRLLVQAEALAAGKGDITRPGQYWLALPGLPGSPVRIAVPRAISRDKPLPVLVALHGAGGSENLFFDGYGNGLAAKLALQRGWFLVATRSGFFNNPDVPAVLDALARRYPIDVKKVCMVGHSMGAAQAVALAGRKPERYAAIAALGGGGSFRPGAGLKLLPFFIGVGKLDFAARPASSLATALEKAGAKTTFKSYPHLEHLAVVQIALPEVFAFFDKAIKGR